MNTSTYGDFQIRISVLLIQKELIQKQLVSICFKKSETAVSRCSSKQVFLKTSQYSQKNTSEASNFPMNIAKFLRTDFFI